jgi:hypothetical protein
MILGQDSAPLATLLPEHPGPHFRRRFQRPGINFINILRALLTAVAKQAGVCIIKLITAVIYGFL